MDAGKGFAVMIFVKWAAFAAVNIYMILASYALSPVIAAWSVITGNPAPRFFAWFYTHDDDLDGNHPLYRPVPTNPVKLWWNRTCWICRNPAYGFAAFVLGFKVADVSVETERVSNGWNDVFRRNGRVAGFGYRRMTPKLNIWLGWACPSHDGKHYMFKMKLTRR